MICVAETSNNGSSPALKPPINKRPSVQQLQNQAILPPHLPPKLEQQHIKHSGQSQSKKSTGPQILPGLNKAKQTGIMPNLSDATPKNEQILDESFIEMLIKCQGTRIEEQRSSLPGTELTGIPSDSKMTEKDISGNANSSSRMAAQSLEAPTVPDEDFFNLIQRLQSTRLEEQRANLPE